MRTMQTTTTTTTTTTTMMTETNDTVPPFELEDKSVVVFEPKVSGMVLTNEVQVPGSTNHSLALGEAVQDYTSRATYETVKVRVLDDGDNLMYVTSSPSHTWTAYPVTGARLGVETSMPIPVDAYASYIADMTISTGSPPKSRAQRVIIKHKPL